MERVEVYLRRAEEAEVQAKTADTGDIRNQFKALAEQWRRLADQATQLALDEARRGAPGTSTGKPRS